MKRKGCVWLVLLAIVGIGYWWFFSRDGGEPQSYEVVRIVDGDTIRVRYNGTVEPVRLIGVDSPETVHPNKPVEFYGVEASNFTKNLLKGERVFLRFGNEERDEYGRILAFVYRAPDELFVNLEIIRQGYGVAIGHIDHRHIDRFIKAEGRAREAKKGLWVRSWRKPIK